MDKQFGGFIITYHRPVELLNTIHQVFEQSFPPQKLWIVDNSLNQVTKEAIQNLKDPRLDYFGVGFNSGPAGAAKIGLELLAKEGYKWVYWGDDNDPPPFLNTFENLFSLIHLNRHLRIGQVGVVGQRFDQNLGKTIRIRDNELRQGAFVLVDTISGNQSKIINSDVTKEGLIPSSELFFGFEELDFDLKLKRAKYLSIVDTKMFLDLRRKHQRINFERPIYARKSISSITREYYSTRNLLIVLKKNRYIIGYFILLFKSVLKGIYGFRYGWVLGSRNFECIFMAIWHSIIKKMGRYEKI